MWEAPRAPEISLQDRKNIWESTLSLESGREGNVCINVMIISLVMRCIRFLA